ncbi:hypothetical protein U1Q18_025922 [Sarracenia purpurea var. burkii]
MRGTNQSSTSWPTIYQAFSDQIHVFGSSDHVFYASPQVSNGTLVVAGFRRSDSTEQCHQVSRARRLGQRGPPTGSVTLTWKSITGSVTLTWKSTTRSVRFV